jgi:hypothetical protein
MIQKIGQAFKKMAQRSMMRGNRGDAQAITEFGITGMRNNLSNQVQNKVTEHLPQTKLTSKVTVDEKVRDIKGQTYGNPQTNVGPQTSNQNPKSNLGGSILDALNE